MTFFRHRINGVGSGGEQWITTLHTLSSASLATAHTAFNTFAVSLWTGALAARWSTLQGMLGTQTDQLDPITARNVLQASTASTHMGTATDGHQSPRSCLVIGLKSASPTRSGRGRMFWPAFTDASIGSDGNFTSAAQTAAATAFGAALVTLGGTTVPVVFHKPTVTGDVINIVQVGNILGTQRRRTNKSLNTFVTAVA